MPAAKPNVFNIPASAPFLPVLIDALRGGRLVPGFPASDDPLELARRRSILPTRRACRLAREVFLDELKSDAAILPRIVALGDLDEDEIAFAQAATGELAEAALALPEAFGALDRRLTLAELIAKWAAAIAPDARRAADRQYAGRRHRARRRSRPPDGRHDHAPGAVGQSRQTGAGRSRRILAAVARIPASSSTRAGATSCAEQNAIEAAERRDNLIEAEAKRLPTATRR